MGFLKQHGSEALYQHTIKQLVFKIQSRALLHLVGLGNAQVLVCKTSPIRDAHMT